MTPEDAIAGGSEKHTQGSLRVPERRTWVTWSNVGGFQGISPRWAGVQTARSLSLRGGLGALLRGLRAGEDCSRLYKQVAPGPLEEGVGYAASNSDISSHLSQSSPSQGAPPHC